MRKILLATALGFATICITQGHASAQWPAPIGHRQPTAESVPSDDSVVGSGIGEHRSAAAPAAKPEVSIPLDDGMNVPNICSNCAQ